MTTYFTLDAVREKSYKLAMNVINSKFIPKYMFSLSQTGATVASHMKDIFSCHGLTINHHSVEVASEKDDLPTLTLKKDRSASILLVDAVWNSGKRMETAEKLIRDIFSPSDIECAVINFRKHANKASFEPRYRCCNWLERVVFPNELNSIPVTVLQNILGHALYDVVRYAHHPDQNIVSNGYTIEHGSLEDSCHSLTPTLKS